MLVLNIGASLVAFLAFVEFVNQIISKHVSYFKYSMSRNTLMQENCFCIPYRFFYKILVYFALLLGNEDVNLNYIIGKLFIPIAFIMGVPSEDVEEVNMKKCNVMA